MTKNMRAAAGAAGLLLALPTLAVTAAAQDGQPVTLAPISIGGDWLGEADKEVVRTHPGGRAVIRQDQFEQNGSSTITEAIRGIPGVQTPPNNGTGSGDFALNIGIRGMQSRLSAGTTILLDGVPLSNAPYGQPETSLAPVSLGMLQAIDVVKGGGSVRYGPNTSGGVVNFVTKDIPKAPFGAEISLRGDNTASSDTDGRFAGKADILLGGSMQNGTGLALMYSGNHGEGYRANLDQDIDDVMLKGKLVINDSSRIEGRLHFYNAIAGLPGPLTQAAFDANRFQSTHSYEEFDGERKEAVLKYVNEFDGNYRLEVTGFHTDSFRQFTLASNSAAGVVAGGSDATLNRLERLPRNYSIWGFEPRFTALLGSESVRHALSVGYRYVNEQTDEKRFRRSGANGFNPFTIAEVLNRDTEGSTDAHAVYIDDSIKIGPVTITPGLRLEHVKVERSNNLTGFKDDETYLEPLPSLSLGWQATEAVFAYANVSTSFNPVTHLALAEAGTQTSLNPERARTYEIGARYSMGGLSLEGGLFWIDFDDQIESVGGININTGATRHRGIELAAEYDFGSMMPSLKGLSVYGTYAYTDAERRQGVNKGNDLQLYSPHVGTLGTRYRLSEWVFNVNAYGQSRQYADDANTEAPSANGKLGRIPGYVLFNTQVAYEFPEGPTVAFGVNNIFDKRYFTRASVENNGGLFVGAPRVAYVQTKFIF